MEGSPESSQPKGCSGVRLRPPPCIPSVSEPRPPRRACQKSQTVKVTVIRRKFTVAATENGENPFDAGQLIYTTKLEKDPDGKSMSLYVRAVDGDADMTPENIGITLKDNILISGDMVEAAGSVCTASVCGFGQNGRDSAGSLK